MTAKDEWRFPYWDFAKRNAKNEFHLPEACSTDKVKIYPPEGVKVLGLENGKIDNPLAGFENPEKDDDGKPLRFGHMPANIPEKLKWSLRLKTASSIPVGVLRTHVMHGICLTDEPSGANVPL